MEHVAGCIAGSVGPDCIVPESLTTEYLAFLCVVVVFSLGLLADVLGWREVLR